MRLVADLHVLAERGLRAQTELLSPHLRRDALLMTTPLLVDDDTNGYPIWIVRHQEKGAIEASAIDPAHVVFHDPYMTLNAAADPVHPSLGAAVAAVTGAAGPDGGVIEIDPLLPLARFDDVAGHLGPGRLRITAAGAPHGAVTTVATEQVVATVARALDRLRPAVAELVAATPVLQPLAPYLDEWSTDTRFADLDALLTREGADAFLATSPVNIEELTAAPGAPGHALYEHGADGVAYGAPGSELLAGSAGRRLLVEERSLGIGEAERLRAQGHTLLYGSDAAAKWRERRDHQYLPAVVLVTRTTRHALDAAVAWTGERVAAGTATTENDVRAAYLDAAAEFTAGLGLREYVTEFFTNCHAGDRSIHPCLATDHPVDDRTTSLKIDAGFAAVVDGLTLATSDAARTRLGDADAVRAYEVLTEIVRSTVAQELRPGTVFAEVHRHVVDRLHARRPELDEAGFWPSDVDLTARYALRNVGHLMGRQESFSSEFRPGDTETLQPGDYGACEIQWPLGRHSIGAEEMWIVLPDRTVTLTG